MDKEKINYFEPGYLFIIAKKLTKDTGVKNRSYMHQTMILVKIISFRWKN
jgi:hypothetical protein